MTKQSTIGISGKMIATITVPSIEELAKVHFEGCRVLDHGDNFVVLERENTFVNTGLNLVLDRFFGINGTPAAPTGIAVSADQQAITGATTLLDPAGDLTGFTRAAFDSTPTRASQTVTAAATFTQATVSFAIHKVGLLNTTTDAGTGLVDVIGGTGNSPFTIDLSTVTTWSLTMQVQITASAT
jgi:hypothetical protein